MDLWGMSPVLSRRQESIGMRNIIIALGAAVGLTMLAMTAQAQPAAVSPGQSAPGPTPEQVQRYIAGHPNIFAQRKIFSIDQVQVRGRVSPEVAEQLQPARTVEQVVALLTANNVEFDRVSTKLDAVGSDPKLIDQIL